MKGIIKQCSTCRYHDGEPCSFKHTNWHPACRQCVHNCNWEYVGVIDATKTIDEQIEVLLEVIERLEALKINDVVDNLHSIYGDCDD